MLVFLEISMLIFFPKLEPSCLLRWSLCFSPQLFPKLVTPSVTNGDVTFPHSSSHLNGPIPTVSPLELVLSCPICYELSAFAFKVEAYYNCRKSVSRKESSSCSDCGHLPQDLNHLFLVLPLGVCVLANASVAEWVKALL